MKKLLRMLGLLTFVGLSLAFPCFADLKIQDSNSASGIVTWNKIEGTDNYILEESSIGPNGPWITVYRGTKNTYQMSKIMKLWYRVHREHTSPNDHQGIALSDKSAVTEFSPSAIFIKKNRLKDGFVEWPAIPPANFYEVQASPSENTAWNFVHKGPYQNHWLKAVPGMRYRVRALMKKKATLISATDWSKPQVFHGPGKGFLRAHGTIIRDQNGHGKEILLQGVNLGALFLIEPWFAGLGRADNPPIEDEWSIRSILSSRFGDSGCQKILDSFYSTFIQTYDMDKLYNLGINTIRLPINYRLLQNEDGSWITDSLGRIDFSKLDRIVNYCADRGMYVVLDLHGAPGSQSKERHSGRKNFNKLFENSPEGEIYRRRTVELWRTIALHYRNDTTIGGYDLLNEPTEPKDALSSEALGKFYDRLYKAIRDADKNHIIMMEAVWDWNALPQPASMGWENVVYQFHY